MPSGRVLVAGPHHAADSWFMDEPGPFPTFNWDEAPDFNRDRYYGNAVQLPGTPSAGNTKVMMIGGTAIGDDDKATATSEIFDERKNAAGWKPGPSWTIARSHANTVQLPDGSMVAVGGGTGVNERLYEATDDQRQVEIYDPASGSWHLGAAQQEARTYHSTALLLPDGRVFSGGDDLNGGNDVDTAEIYSPPYLFKGPRPVIEAVPASVAFGAKAIGAGLRPSRCPRRARRAWRGDPRRRHEPAHRAAGVDHCALTVASTSRRRPTATSPLPATTCCSCSTRPACRRSPAG